MKQEDANIKQRIVYNCAMKIPPSAEDVTFSFNSVFIGGIGRGKFSSKTQL